MPNTDVQGVKTKQRFTYIDPNTFASYFSAKSNPYVNTQELSWNPEDLAMSVDLQVIIPRRSDKGQENYFIKLDDIVMKNSGKSPIARYVSYMGGIPLNQKENSESYITDNYTNISFQEIKDGKVIDKESLGIDSIDINFDAHFFPIITIKFTDVRGASLFMPTEYEFEESLKGNSAPNSFFKALFHFPYPRFLLSIKGFYGNRVTFQLAVSDFRSEFQSDSGNYDITVQFIGYVYGLYTDLPLNLVMASPYYNMKYWEDRVSDGTFKYRSKDGGTGGDIITYVKFLTKLDDKNVNLENVESAYYTGEYSRYKKELEFLTQIKNLHSSMLENSVGTEDKVAKRVGSKNIFLWGTYDTGTTTDLDTTGFSFDAEISKKYYSILRDFFKYFTDNSSTQVSIVTNGNVFIDNFAAKVQGNAIDVIRNDKDDTYLGVFSAIKAKKITELFTMNATQKNIVANCNNFVEAVDGDDILLGDTRFQVGGDLKKNTKLKQDVTNGVVIDKDVFLANINARISELKKQIEDSVKDVTNELVSIFEEVVGFAPTVENFYRMLFAHIDCFINYFNVQILGEITKQTNKGERKLGWFNNGDTNEIKISQLDIPRTITGGNDETSKNVDIYPFPGYYLEKHEDGSTRSVAEYPGKSDNSRFSEIQEVKAVDKILTGTNFVVEKINEIANNSGNAYSGDVFSILSPLYNGSNPWDTVEFTFADEEVEAYKMLYFYMSLFCADKAAGTDVYKKLTDTDDYVTRVVNLLRKKIISAPETFSDTLQTIINKIDSDNGLDTLLENIKRFKLNNFVISPDNKNKLIIDNTPENDDDNYIPLKITGHNLNKPVSELMGSQTSKHWCINTKKDSNHKYLSITGDGMLTDEFSSEEICKGFNDKLIEIGEGSEYLQGLGAIGYGLYGVSMPKATDLEVIAYRDCTDCTFTDDSVGAQNRQIAYYNTSEAPAVFNHPFRHKYCVTNSHWWHGGVHFNHGGQTDFNIDAKIKDITSDIRKYYKDGEGSATVYPVNFVGWKPSGYSVDDAYGGQRGYVKDRVIYDSYPATNLFSGVKTYCLDFNGKTPAYLIKDGEIASKKPDGCSDSEWKTFKAEANIYLPLIKGNRCNYSDVTENDKKYAVATYLCAVLSGTEGLRNIIKNITTCKLSKPCRLVNILYLGGVLYFQKKYKDAGKIDNPDKFYELVKSDGQLGHGLLLNDRKETQLSNQPNVDLKIFDYPIVVEMLIRKFETWCKNEFLPIMFDRLSKIATNEEDGYEDLLAFCGEKTSDRLVYVQGYKKDGDCEKWLTKLSYSYTHLLSITYCNNEVSILKDDIIKFLQLLINKTNVEGAKTESTPEQEKNTYDTKTALYYTLKNLYDKWLCTYTDKEFKLKSPDADIQIRKERFCNIDLNAPKNGTAVRKSLKTQTSEYNNFVYVDQFYNDISSTYIMDADRIGTFIKDIFRGKTNVDVYTFMAGMAEKNNLMLIALPVFNNMYNASSIASVFSPNTLYNANSYDGINGVGTTYVVMYTNDVSHQPSLYNGYEFNRDYIDIADIIENKGSEDLKYFGESQNGSNKMNYNITAFGVTYGKQNQMYFKKINVSMDNPKTTDEAIRNTLMISDAASQGPTEQPITIGNNLYSIYANRSYTCTVEMLGCANITPLMYFQLNNIPMFRGLYMIINVKHSIKAGDMTTVFTGVRVSRYSLPDVTDTLMHSNVFRNIMDKMSTGALPSSGGYISGTGVGIEELGLNGNPVDMVLWRRVFTNDYTEGQLYINGKYFCDTVEDKDREVEKNGCSEKRRIKNSGCNCTAIPCGDFKVYMGPTSISSNVGEKPDNILPGLYNVPCFDGIRIHGGGSAKASAGCIIIGKRDRAGHLIECNDYVKKLKEVLRRSGGNVNGAVCGKIKVTREYTPPEEPETTAKANSCGLVSIKDYIPDVIIEAKYATSDNFTGKKVPGYEKNDAWCTERTAQLLAKAAEAAKKDGYKLKIWDAYRPKKACDEFKAWAKNSDTSTKAKYYPNIDKSQMLGHYIASGVSYHAYGTAIDLTLVYADTGKEVDMGGEKYGIFDFFGQESASEYAGKNITDKHKENRKKLKKIMTSVGFKPISSEWWHFQLAQGSKYYTCDIA